ncbi:hypothetical protein Tco_0579496 [Tanacetum coccineum]
MYIFNSSGRKLGKVEILELDGKYLAQAHRYVLLNHSKIQPFRESYEQNLLSMVDINLTDQYEHNLLSEVEIIGSYGEVYHADWNELDEDECLNLDEDKRLELVD